MGHRPLPRHLERKAESQAHAEGLPFGDAVHNIQDKVERHEHHTVLAKLEHETGKPLMHRDVA